MMGRRARPHPKPAGRKSAAERREEPRRSSRGPLCPRQRAQARVASERTASEFHPQPAKHAAGVLARRGQPPPAQAAPSRVSGGAVAEAGAAIPERREAERGSA